MRRLNQQLTGKFWLSEFLVSKDYPELARELSPTDYQVDTLRLLCQSCWQPVRDRWGRIDINSGFRSDDLNILVGGAEDSDHLRGMAGDGVPREARIGWVYRWIVWKNLPYRQCIWYKDRAIIHMSINIPGRPYNHEHWSQRG